jgi:hypothetical protein
MTIAEREGHAHVPHVQGTMVVPQLGGFMAQTAKKS